MHSTLLNGLNFISLFSTLLLYLRYVCVFVWKNVCCCFECHHSATIYRSLINLVAIEWQTQPALYCMCVSLSVCARFCNFLLPLLCPYTVCGSEQIAIGSVRYMRNIYITRLSKEKLVADDLVIHNEYQF